jgi:hypothetical protein
MLQDSLHGTSYEFAPFSQGGTTLQHLRSPRSTGCLLRGGLTPTTDRTCTGKQTMTLQDAPAKVGRQIGYVSLCSRVGLLSAALVELQEELLNLLAACIGETPVLADNPEPTFFQDP